MNYCRAADLIYIDNKVQGVVSEDTLTGRQYPVRAGCVVNATGVWVDELRQKDGDANAGDGRKPTKPMVAPSQGVHIVVDREFLGGDTALMVPKTADGRVLLRCHGWVRSFWVPPIHLAMIWHGSHLLLRKRSHSS